MFEPKVLYEKVYLSFLIIHWSLDWEANVTFLSDYL